MSDLEYIEDMDPTVRSKWMARMFVLNTLDPQWTYDLTRRRRKTLADMGHPDPNEVPRPVKISVTRTLIVAAFEQLLKQRPDEVHQLWDQVRTIDPSIPPLEITED